MPRDHRPFSGRLRLHRCFPGETPLSARNASRASCDHRRDRNAPLPPRLPGEHRPLGVRLFKYSDEKHGLSVAASGSFEATPEQAFDCSAGLYLQD